MAMIRDIHPDTYAALQVDGFHPILMVHVDWPDQAVRAHTGLGDILWNGETWVGVGPFGGIDIPAEASGTAVPAEARLSIVGTVENILAELDLPVRNRDVDIYVALATEPQGNVLIGAPVELLIGYADSNEMDYRADGEGAAPAFFLGVNSGPSVRMVLSAAHSNEDQQLAHVGDELFRHTALSELDRVNPPSWPEK